MKEKSGQTSTPGNSSFVRSKLDDQYNPKLPTIRHSFMMVHRNNVPNPHAFATLFKEESEMCDRAVESVKMGSKLVIDWNTKSNFRATKSNFIKKIKTEPIEKYQEVKQSHRLTRQNSPQIQLKKNKLDKLLKIKHKKHYMLNRKELEAQKQHLVQRSKTDCHKIGSFRSSLIIGSNGSPKQESIGTVQQRLLKKCKLSILKQDLKIKFKEIRLSVQNINQISPHQ